MNFMEDLKKRRAYRQTINELRRLPRDVAVDLGIHGGDIKAIAHRAVYGK